MKFFLIACSMVAMVSAKCNPFTLNGYSVNEVTVPGYDMQEKTMDLAHIPDWFHGMKSYVPQLPQHKGAQMKLNCCGYSCDYYLVFYRCHTCDSVDGGLISKLLDDKWSAHDCAPKFKQDYVKHPMVTLKKRLSANEEYTLDVESTLGYFVAFRSAKDTSYWCRRPQGAYQRPGKCGQTCANNYFA